MTDNELIAEFMGVSVAFHGPVLYHSDEDGFIDFKGGAEPYWPDKDWNELMPVVEKIERLGYTVYIFDNHCKIWEAGADPNKEPIAHGWSGNVSDSQKIPGTFEAVVEFIKWYNSNHPQP